MYTSDPGRKMAAKNMLKYDIIEANFSPSKLNLACCMLIKLLIIISLCAKVQKKMRKCPHLVTRGVYESV